VLTAASKPGGAIASLAYGAVRDGAPPAVPFFQFGHDRVISDGLPLRPARRASGRSPIVFARALLVAALLAGAGTAAAESLWRAETSLSLVSDKRAHAVGDLLTIVIQENNTASKNNSTATSKDSSIDAAIATFLYSPGASTFLTKGGQMPALKTSAKQAFNGGGKISNEEKITARIGVRVVDVLPNGNLVIEGRRTTSFSGESQDAVLRGVVRAEDITASNTVFSYNIADATIKYITSGTLTDNQRKGWFTKIWEKLTPF
jgi:flagellar L-ring protein precursor FlgH